MKYENLQLLLPGSSSSTSYFSSSASSLYPWLPNILRGLQVSVTILVHGAYIPGKQDKIHVSGYVLISKNSSTLIFEIQIISMCHLKGRIPSLLKYSILHYANTAQRRFSLLPILCWSSTWKRRLLCVQKLSYICMLSSSVLPTIVTPRSVSVVFLHGNSGKNIHTFPHPPIIFSCGVPWTLDSAFLLEFLVMMGMFYICSYDI